MTTYSDYDPFAWIYNRHWGVSFIPHALPALEKLVFPHLPKRAEILDLCCGTGQLTRLLTTYGYRVTGLDGSAEMLSYALENAPDAELIHADARSFKLPSSYHAVISVFDSLNHIMTIDDLTKVFSNVFTVLRQDGIFLFDLNMEPGFRLTWEDNFGIVEEDHICVVRTSYRPEERIASFDATVFRLQDNWYRSDFSLYQKCYAETEILSALEIAGFNDIRTFAYNEQQQLREQIAESERTFFLCRKSTD